MKVFIVEDSPPVLERLMDMVGGVQGTQLVGNARTFPDAVAGIMATRPDVAILDIKLAGGQGSGLDVLTRVKAEMPGLRAIVLSNYTTLQHLKASTEAGAEFFLDKSVDFERITGILERWQHEIAV